MKINNETVGISAEIAIANAFEVDVNEDYAQRADDEVVDYIQPYVIDAFIELGIPRPMKHCAERQNPVDFMLYNGQTLSVKSNKAGQGKVAPQVIGQPTDETYFDEINEHLKFDIIVELENRGLKDNYESRSKIFKEITLNRIGEIINVYWEHLFSCDYLLYVYNVIKKNKLLNEPCFMVFNKSYVPPLWDPSKFSFTRNIDSWNESNTLKYCNYSIGEFQAHKNRNCLKFRFNLDGIIKLLDSGIISYN